MKSFLPAVLVIVLLFGCLAQAEKVIPESKKITTIANGNKLTLGNQGYANDSFLNIKDLSKTTLQMAELAFDLSYIQILQSDALIDNIIGLIKKGHSPEAAMILSFMASDIDILIAASIDDFMKNFDAHWSFCDSYQYSEVRLQFMVKELADTVIEKQDYALSINLQTEQVGNIIKSIIANLDDETLEKINELSEKDETEESKK